MCNVGLNKFDNVKKFNNRDSRVCSHGSSLIYHLALSVLNVMLTASLPPIPAHGVLDPQGSVLGPLYFLSLYHSYHRLPSSFLYH